MLRYAKKASKDYNGGSPRNLITSDQLWLPSYRELGYTNSNYIESSGPIYSEVFKNAETRSRSRVNGSNYGYWTRSSYTDNASAFLLVQSDARIAYSNANNTRGVVLGFCTGAST